MKKKAAGLCVIALAVNLLPATAYAQTEKRERPAVGDPRKENAEEAPTPEEKKKRAEADKLAQRLLDEAYGLSKNLATAERAFLLGRLAESQVRLDKAKALRYSEEAFAVTADMKPGMQRQQIEATAVGAAGEADPEQGLQLLARMSEPAARNDGTMPPDMRNPMTGMLFQKLYQAKGAESIETIAATARRMGDAGNYPFMAVGMTARQLDRKDPEAAKELVNQALAFANNRKPSPESTQQLAMFLRSNRQHIPLSVMKSTLEGLIKEALETKDDNTLVANLSVDGKSKELRGASNLALFQLMPLVRELDAEWAKKLESQNETLRNAADFAEQRASEGGGQRQETVAVTMRVEGSGTPPPDMMEEMRSMQVDELAQRDPLAASKQIENIKNPAIRAAAAARVAGELSKSDPEAAARLLKEAKQAMAEAKEPAQKLRILVGLTQAQAAMKDREAFAESMEKGFAIGETLFRAGSNKNPNMPVFGQPGFQAMTQLTRLAMKIDEQAALAKLSTIDGEYLHALLLVAAADGLDPTGRRRSGGMRITIQEN